MSVNELPRDKAERILRNAIEMQARHGDSLSSDSVYEIARSLGVDDAYVYRAWEQENAAEEAARAPHGCRNRTESRFSSALFALAMLSGGIGMFGVALLLATVGREAAGQGEIWLGVFVIALTVLPMALGATLLNVAWKEGRLALRPGARQRR